MNTKKVKEVKQLSARARMFALEYAVDFHITKAAIRAGFSPHTACEQGSRMLADPRMQVAIGEAMKAREKRTNINADYVIETIVETIERCRQSEPVLDRSGKHVTTETEDGDEVNAYTFNAAGVLRGAELLGKHLGMFTDRIVHSGDPSAPVVVEMTQIELARRLAFLLTSTKE